MSLNINVMFDGNCREAVTFYAKVFGQETPHFITYGESDTSFDPNVQVSDKGRELIMSTSLDIAGSIVTFNDMPDNFEFIRGNSFGIIVSYDNADEAKTIFDRLGKKGQVFVPFAEIPGQGKYGMLADQYNIMWTVKA